MSIIEFKRESQRQAETSEPQRHAVRRSGPELLRIISSAGIVWFHALAPGEVKAAGASWAYGGLPALMAISVAFSTVPTEANAWRIAAKRFSRLMEPWIFWSAIYLLAIIARSITAPDLPTPWRAYMLLTGPAIHLWYLPFAWVMTTLISLLFASRVLQPDHNSNFLWLVAYGVVFVAASAAMATGFSVVPVVQWIFVIPSVILGVFIGSMAHGRRRMKVVLVMLGVTLAVAGFCVATRIPALVRPYLAGTLILTVASMMQRPASRSLLSVSRLSLGVYLIHPLFYAVFAHMAGLKCQPELTATVVILLSFATTAMLVRMPWISRFV